MVFHFKIKIVDVGHPVVDVGHPVVDVGHPVVDVGHPVVDVGHPVVDVGHPVVDVGHPVVDERESYEESECLGRCRVSSLKLLIIRLHNGLGLINDITNGS